MKRRGRKIYRAQVGDRKRKNRKFLKTFAFILLLAALGFVGYSIGKPIYKFISDKAENGSENATVPWTPPVLPDETEVTTAAEKPPAEDVPDEENEIKHKTSFSAYLLPESAMASADSLKAALENIKGSGYTAAAVTMKAKGGKIYYSTSSEMALTSEDAVAGTMSAAQIAEMINGAGFMPVAKINILEDNNRYGEYKTGSYRFDGESSTWLDNALAKGGKPWLSPFDPDTQGYAAYISNEVSAAGFEYIFLDGIVFPPFRNSDLNYIGNIVKSPDRYKALITTADIAAKAAEANGQTAAVTVSAAKIINGTEEVFKPDELTVNVLAVEYFPAALEKTAVIDGEEIALADLNAYDKTYVVFSEIIRLSGDGYTVIPVLKQSDHSQADFNDMITALMDLNISSYMIIG